MTKYEPLTTYLNLCKKTSIKLTYSEIEEILGFELPLSARKYKEWWGNGRSHPNSQSKAWEEAGYKTTDVILGESVVFEKVMYKNSKTVNGKLVTQIKNTMEYIEIVASNLGEKIEEYYIGDMGCPHKQPSNLPKGYSAIYIFVYIKDDDCEFLKIGKVNEKSTARFVSQHYGFSAPSTLAKSLCKDNRFALQGVSESNVKEWMLNNLHRINIYVKSNKAQTELIEAMLHYAFRPTYEGNI